MRVSTRWIDEWDGWFLNSFTAVVSRSEAVFFGWLVAVIEVATSRLILNRA